MKHNTKKALSLLLASIMLLSLLPLTAYAGEGTEKEQATAEGTEEKISDQGTRGGVLNASGESNGGAGAEHVHAWSEWATAVAPTCTEAGSRTRICACGESETEPVEALGHAWGEWTDETAPICTEAGSHTHACTRCEASETVSIDALGHEWGAWTDEKAPSCTEAGEHTHVCDRCGESETVEIPALGHDWGEWTVLKEATKTETGEREHTCLREGCGVTVSEEIPVLPPDEYTVRFMNGETEVASVSVAENTAIGDQLPAGPDKGAAYVFAGWFDSENKAVNKETVVTGPLTASAKYNYLPEGSGTATAGAVTVNASWAAGTFPEGTTLRVTDAGRSKALSMAQSAGIEAVDGEAVDITFRHGEESIQPAAGKNVNISFNLSRSLAGNTFTVLHEKSAPGMAAKAAKSTKSAASNVETVSVGASANSASFVGSSFSVYAVVGGTYQEDPTELPRWTYEFYVGTTKVNTQIVKDGDTLYEPSVPDAGTNQRFTGWQVQNETGYLDFSTPVSVTGTTDATKHVDAVFVTEYKVIFYADEAKTAIFQQVIPDTGTVSTANYVLANTETARFDGWYLAGDMTKTPVTSATPNDADVELLPLFTPGVWVTFDSLGGSYVEPVFTTTGTVAEPTAPTRAGYDFKGWYTSEDSATNLVAADKVSFPYTVPAGGATLYAGWQPVTVPYLVHVWTENANDSGYTHTDTLSRTALTGTVLTTNMFTNIVPKDLSATVFEINTEMSDEAECTVAGDGTTVRKVYFKRKLYTAGFYNNSATQLLFTVENVKYNENFYNKIVTAAAAAGVTFPENGKGWRRKYFPDDLYTPDAYIVEIGSYIISAGALVGNVPLDANGYVRFVRDNPTVYQYYRDQYFEVLDEETTPAGAPRVTYDGKEYYLYSLYRPFYDHSQSNLQNNRLLGFMPFAVKDVETGENITIYNQTENYIQFHLYSYTMYGKQYHTLFYRTTFHLSFDGAELPIQNVLYEDRLLNYQDPGYVIGETEKQLEGGKIALFQGWYDNDECVGEAVDLSTARMPGSDLTLYAKWEVESFTVSFDPDNGETIDPLTVESGDQIAPADRPSDPVKEGYTFICWEDEDGNPFNFDTHITKDYDLKAVYQSTAVYTVAYEPGDYGTFSKTDSNSYIDGASAVVLGAPTVTDSTKVFTGWQVGPPSRSSALKLPGESFEIDAAKADENKVITLYAQYASKPGLTTLTYEPNGGQGSSVTEENIGENNETTTVKDPDDIGIEPQPGWEFLYWTTNADGSGDKFHPTELIALNLNGVRVLYAQWKLITIDVTVTKSWDDNDDQDGKRPDTLTVTLSGGGETYSVELNGTVDDPIPSDADGYESGEWVATFVGVPKYKDGTEIAYQADEQSVPRDYEKTSVSGSTGTGFTITNSHTPEQIELTLTKVWDDANNQDGKRPRSVVFLLSGGGSSQSVTMTGTGSTWTKKVTVYKYAGGQEIQYEVDEPSVPAGYTKTVDNSTLTITNKHEPEKIDIPVRKVWNDLNDRYKRRPTSVTIRLLADGEETGESLVLNAASGWRGTFTGLYKYSGGRAIVYSVAENRVAHYRLPVIRGSAAVGFTVTNTYRYSNSPQTGDHTPWLPWMGALLLSGLALGGDMLLRKNRRRYSGKHEK